MSSSQAIYRDSSNADDRRSCPRKPLNGVVLVFFGKNNWGKVVEVNESGMSLEFDQPPPLRQGISFSLEATCRAAAPSAGEMISNSVRVDGEVKWLREFERTAGVEFLNPTDVSRQQVRQWLSFDAYNSDTASGRKANDDGPVPQAEELGPVPSLSQTPDRVNDHTPERDLEIVESNLEPFHEAHPSPRPIVEHGSSVFFKSFANDSPAEYEPESFQLPEYPLADSERRDQETHPKRQWSLKGVQVFAGQFLLAHPNEQLKRNRVAGLRQHQIRAWVIGVSAGLGVLAVVAGVRMTSPQWMRKIDAVERVAGPSANESESTDLKSGRAHSGQHLFFVEVLDADNRRRLLRFVDDPGKRTTNEISHKSDAPSFPRALPVKVAERKRAPGSSETRPIHKFRLDISKAKQPAANGLAVNPRAQAAPAPEFVVGLPPSLETPPIGGVLANPISNSRILPVGGKVQPPHLIKSVPPNYPGPARTIRVDGDVTMDALIDEAGNVTSATVLAGPPVLQQAAIDALLQWKYEPARLDGNPVSIHLSVTMKFRIK